MEKTVHRKTITGVVVSNKMMKTVVMKIDSKKSHPKYIKTVKKTNTFKVHDEKNQCEVGDIIEIIETRPLSKDKRWKLLNIIKKGIQ